MMTSMARIQGRSAALSLREVHFLLWMNYTTLARLKQLFSPALYIYWDTWKAAVINQVCFHIPHRTTRLLRFRISIAPCEVLPLANTKRLQIRNLKTSGQCTMTNDSYTYVWNKMHHIIILINILFPHCPPPVKQCVFWMPRLPSAAILSWPFCVYPGQHFSIIHLVDEWRLCMPLLLCARDRPDGWNHKCTVLQQT